MIPVINSGGCFGLNQAFDDTNIRGSVTITASGTANAKGSYAQLVASTPFEAKGILINLEAGNIDDKLIDIAVGGAGSEMVIIADIFQGARVAQYQGNTCVYFPIRIPAGVRLSARCQCSNASRTTLVGVTLFKGDERQSGILPLASKIITLGAVAGSSRGTTITPSSSANTWLAWTQLVATAGAEIYGLMVAIGGAGQSSKTAAMYRYAIGVGASSGESTIHEWIGGVVGSSYRCTGYELGFVPCRISAAQRIALRVMCDTAIGTASNRTFDITLYGLVQ